MRNGAILLATGPWDPESWAGPVRAAAAGRPLHIWPDLPDPAAIRYALVWKPPEGLLATLPNLEAIFSLGAGVDHFIFQKGLPDKPIVRVVNPDLTQRMTEWVVLHVLLHHRRQPEYSALQAERRWQELTTPAAGDVRVGMLGLGELGRAAGEALARLGYRVAGWSRRPQSIPGIETFHGSDGLDAFLARTEIMVALLPLTPETRGILALPLFHKLARDVLGRGAVVINGGRGGLQVDADLASAVRNGTLRGATLDVFEPEPLDRESPLWAVPGIVITPHVAATSTPAAIAPDVVRQIEAFEDGVPLPNLVDRARFY